MYNTRRIIPPIQEYLTRSMADQKSNKPSLSYRDAGVNIDAGNKLIERIKPAVSATHRPGVLGGIGGFGGLFELPTDKYRQPVLVSGTDGVGTKLKLAIESGHHSQIGIDLVAMCANDVLVTGAEPLFFLDYYATGELDLDIASSVIEGIAEGCKRAGAALVGGETAEMPGIYSGSDYDLAGFCVGIVEKDQILSGDSIADGDQVIGIASSGPHSNGYSLIRKVLEVSNTELTQAFGDSTIGQVLLEPTHIYTKEIMHLLSKVDIRAVSHITGGGLPENLPRVIPDDYQIVINQNAWQRPKIFDWLQDNGGISESEMLRTFNCGVGMVLIVAAEDADNVLAELHNTGSPQAWNIGTIEKKNHSNQASIDIKPR